MWLWFAAPFLIGALLSGADPSNPFIWLEFLVLGPVYCLLVYGVNDVYDYETDLQNERKGEGKSQGDVLKKQYHSWVLKSSAVAAVILLLVSAATQNLFNIAGMVFLVAWGLSYSMPPLRLKERPVIDSISNGFGYLLVPFAMGFSFGAPVSSLPAQAYVGGLVVASLHAMFAVLDYEPDKKAGVNTIAIRFGARRTILIPVTISLGALVSPVMSSAVAKILLGSIFILNALIALDLHGKIVFKKSYRDHALGAVYLLAILLTSYFVIQQRTGIL